MKKIIRKILLFLVAVVLIIVVGVFMKKDKKVEEKTPTDNIDLVIDEIIREENEGDNQVIEGNVSEELPDNQIYYVQELKEHQLSSTNSDLSINEDMVKIAESLGFELLRIDYYLDLTKDDLMTEAEAYDVLRALNLYLAAKEVSYYDKLDIVEKYDSLKDKYIELKYGGATTKNYDAKKFNLNGVKPKSEVKLSSYDYLLNSKVIPARFFYPRAVIEKSNILYTEQEDVDAIAKNDVEKAWKLMKEKAKVYESGLNERQKKDLIAVNEIVKIYNEAVIATDYNAVAKIMNKEFRESFGPSILATINNGYKKEFYEFIPNHIDDVTGLMVGYALAAYTDADKVKEATGSDGTVDEDSAISYEIKFMSFRENNAGEWELYYNVDTNFADYNSKSFRE